MIVYQKELMKPSVIGIYPSIETLYNTIPRETRLHMERVGVFCRYYYSYLLDNYSGTVRNNVIPEFDYVCEELFRYHDLGRAYIPTGILNKVAALTEEERQIIKNHTIYARDAIKAIYSFPYTGEIEKYFVQIAVSHHERYDGGGYPEGLLAGEIPFLARICAVADTFDGITSWKPYKTRQTDRNKAKEIILSESGRQFDPFIAKTFAEVIPFLPEI